MTSGFLTHSTDEKTVSELSFPTGSKIVSKDIITNVQKARQALKEVRYTQVKFLNHCLDRCHNVRQHGRFLPSQVFRSPEMCHVLKLRNCIQIDDIREQPTVPKEAKKDIGLRSDWINGALLLTSVRSCGLQSHPRILSFIPYILSLLS